MSDEAERQRVMNVLRGRTVSNEANEKANAEADYFSHQEQFKEGLKGQQVWIVQVDQGEPRVERPRVFLDKKDADAFLEKCSGFPAVWVGELE